jgi:hypothetical protein
VSYPLLVPNGILTVYVLHVAELFSKAADSSATQELPNILENPKVQYRVHERSLVHILSQINPVRTSTTRLSKICLNIVLPPNYICSC